MMKITYAVCTNKLTTTELEAILSLQLYLKDVGTDELKMAHLIDFLQVCL